MDEHAEAVPIRTSMYVRVHMMTSWYIICPFARSVLLCIMLVCMHAKWRRSVYVRTWRCFIIQPCSTICSFLPSAIVRTSTCRTLEIGSARDLHWQSIFMTAMPCMHHHPWHASHLGLHTYYMPILPHEAGRTDISISFIHSFRKFPFLCILHILSSQIPFVLYDRL